MKTWLLLLLALVGVFPAYGQSALIEQSFPSDPANFCATFAREFKNPFIEFDSDLCTIQRMKLEKTDKARLEALRQAHCQNLATVLQRPNLSTDWIACSNVGSEFVIAQTRRNRDYSLLGSLLPVDKARKTPSYCEVLAKKLEKPEFLKEPGREQLCPSLVRQYFLSNPEDSIKEYRSYCTELVKSFPQMPQSMAERACPAVMAYIEEERRKTASNEAANSAALRGTIVRWGIYTLLGLGACALVWFVATSAPRNRRKAAEKLHATLEARQASALAQFGRDIEERERTIQEVFDKRDQSLSFEEQGFSQWTLSETKQSGTFSVSFRITRALGTMAPQEVTALRIAYLLANRLFLSAAEFDEIRFGVIYGDGKAQVEQCEWDFEGQSETAPAVDAGSALSTYAKLRAISAQGAVTAALSALSGLPDEGPHPAFVKALRQRVHSGNEWLSEGDLPNSAFEPRADHPSLLLGLLKGTDTPLTYAGGRSLITIAPPGSGKTQCHVLPNLVTWPCAAMVLDVTGDLYPATSGWRSQNVGTVYRFAPLEPENSDCFNPLTFVRGDRFNVMEDALALAKLMVIQEGKGAGDSGFWEDSAVRLLATMIAHVCAGIEPHQRSMNTVHALANRVGWNEFVAELCSGAAGIASMAEEGNALLNIEPKLLDSYLQTLKRSLQPWAGERVREVTKRSDWSPLDLRGDAKPTIYLTLKTGEIDAFSSVLRVFVGMHVRALIAQRDGPQPPILFMLDELPRLRYMPPIEEALEIGRASGLWLWMFAQNLGQMEKAYPNASGMIGSCAVQAYMNPAAHDKTADRIADQLGFREGALDGQRRRLVEPSELTGPEYRDDVIVFGVSSKPARAAKVFAHKTEAFRSRLGLPLKDRRGLAPRS